MKILHAASFFLFPLALTIPVTAGSSEDVSAQIDHVIAKAWKQNDVKGNPIASDEVFVRRVYLDAVGRIPTYEEATTFLASEDKNKRAKLIDELLHSEGYVNHFFNYWADILRVNDNLGGGQNIAPYYREWVRDALANNMPYDEFVREMITAQGQAPENGAIGYTYRDRGMPLDHMANTVRIFLGTRLECAQCHNHPFDSWTQMDFFQMAAFSYGMNPNARSYGDNYNQVRSKLRQVAENQKEAQNLQRALQEIMRPIRNNNRVEYQDKLPQLPHDYQYTDAKPKDRISPAAMFGEMREIENVDDRLACYAEWMTSPDNPRFTTVIANRLWKKLMGVGMFEPVDEFMEGSTPSNAELMNLLEQHMVNSGYDMKAFMASIMNSKVYQREASQVELELGDTYHYPGPLLRRMSAEQIWDSIVTLVNPQPELGNWKAAQQNELRVQHMMRMQEVVGKKSEKELIEFSKQIAAYQKELQNEVDRLTKQAAKAREEGNNEKARDLAREANQVRNKLRNRIEKVVYEPGLKKAGVEFASMETPLGNEMDVTPAMVNTEGRPTGEFRKAQEKIEEKLVADEMNQMGIEEENRQKRYIAVRRSGSRYMRAAHLRSPAPNGHFLQMFGQSDRETIENATTEASVPQALNLMNGPDFPQVAGNNSFLSFQLEKVEGREDKLDMIFLSILSRKPTADERDLILAEAEQRGDKIYEDAIFALMNGREFLFVQ